MKALKIILLAATLGIVYGWATDCKDTAGVYTYCGFGGLSSR